MLALRAYAIVEGDTVNNTNAFVIWLLPEQGNWLVQYAHFVTTTMVGKSADDLQKIAATENAKQHAFNALIFCAAALQLADRGPFFQLAIRPEIEKAIGNVQRLPILQGQAPFVWKFDKSTFRVLNVGPIGIGGNIYLLVAHEVEPWAEDKQADRQNRDLITAFAKANPEYKEAFAGLVVRALAVRKPACRCLLQAILRFGLRLRNPLIRGSTQSLREPSLGMTR